MSVDEESLLSTILEQVYFVPILFAKMEQMAKCQRPECGRLRHCSNELVDKHARYIHQECRVSTRRKNPTTLSDKGCCLFKNMTNAFWELKIRQVVKPPKILLTV